MSIKNKTGGFGIGLGVGAAVATPLGNFALGEGQSKDCFHSVYSSLY